MFGLRLNRNVIRMLRLTLPWMALFSGGDSWAGSIRQRARGTGHQFCYPTNRDMRAMRAFCGSTRACNQWP